MTKKQIIGSVVAVLLIVGAVWGYSELAKPAVPVIGEDGKISGAYSIEGIMRLGRPYICKFEKQDDATKVAGTIRTDGKYVQGEFRILSPQLNNQEFNSFLLVKDNDTYTWTSLLPIGYKSKVAKSATSNASPSEQSQIIGTRDTVQYECDPWNAVDQSVFEVPTWVSFSEIK